MRIVSNFFDYYDALASHDKDDITYYRVKKEVALHEPSLETSNLPIYPTYNYRDFWHAEDRYYLVKLLFCDFIYYGYHFNDKYYYDAVKFEEDYREIVSKRGWQDFNKVGYDWETKKKMSPRDWVYKNLDNNKVKPKTDYSNLNCPVVKFCRHARKDKFGHKIFVVELNTNLKELEFFRCVDTYTAYQEIERWIGNQAPEHKPIPEIDDVTMRDIKGFDRYSFRKEKSK